MILQAIKRTKVGDKHTAHTIIFNTQLAPRMAWMVCLVRNPKIDIRTQKSAYIQGVVPNLNIIPCPDLKGRLGTTSPDWKRLPMLMFFWPPGRAPQKKHTPIFSPYAQTKKRHVSVILHWP